MPQQNILITEIGNCVEVTENFIKLGENVQAGARLIDGEGFEDYGTSEVIKERLKIANDGIFTVALAVTGDYVINEPLIESHGFVVSESSGTNEEIKSVVQRAVMGYDYANGNKDELLGVVKKALRNYFFKKTKQSPFIVVSILEI